MTELEKAKQFIEYSEYFHFIIENVHPFARSVEQYKSLLHAEVAKHSKICEGIINPPIPQPLSNYKKRKPYETRKIIS